ncbi:MAG: Dirigent-like protein [bacterium]|jgi:hypothetical protein
MERVTIILGTLATLGLTTAGVAAGAAGGHASGRQTMRLHVHWTGGQQVDSAPTGDSPGDFSVTAGDLFTPAGKKVGHIQGHCITVPRENQECAFTLALPGGHLQMLAGYGSGFSGETTGADAIVGGTGVYRNARGDSTERETSDDTVEATLRIIR